MKLFSKSDNKLEEIRSELQTQIFNVGKNVDEIKESINAKIDEKIKAVAEVHNKGAEASLELSKAVEAIAAKCDSLTKEVATLTNKVNSLTTENTYLKKELKAMAENKVQVDVSGFLKETKYGTAAKAGTKIGSPAVTSKLKSLKDGE